MLVYNPFQHDSRVLKEGSTLAAAGYEVELIALAGPGLPGREQRDGIDVVRVEGRPRSLRVVESLRRLLASGGPHAAAAPSGTAAGGRPTGVAAAVAGALARLRPVAEGAYGTLAWWRFARSAEEAERARRPDIVLAHDLNTLPVATRIARRAGARLLYDSHEVFVELPVHSRAARTRWLRVERSLLPRVDAMWMSSPGHAEVFAENHGVPVPPVIVNAPSMDPDPRARGVPDLHEELRLDAELRIALYIGGVFPHRPLDALLETARELDRCAMVIMGPGLQSYVEELRRRADELGVGDRVRLVDPVPVSDVVRYAAAGDVGVIPFLNTSLNNFHGLPNKIFEYVAAGIPVVASDFPQLRAVIDRHRVGRTFDPELPGDLTRAIGEVLDDPTGLAELRESAATAARTLNWEVEARGLLDIVTERTGEKARQAMATPAAVRTAGR